MQGQYEKGAARKSRVKFTNHQLEGVTWTKKFVFREMSSSGCDRRQGGSLGTDSFSLWEKVAPLCDENVRLWGQQVTLTSTLVSPWGPRICDLRNSRRDEWRLRGGSATDGKPARTAGDETPGNEQKPCLKPKLEGEVRRGRTIGQTTAQRDTVRDGTGTVILRRAPQKTKSIEENQNQHWEEKRQRETENEEKKTAEETEMKKWKWERE